LAFTEQRVAVEAPDLRIEHHRPQRRAVQHALQRARQRETAGPADHHLVGGHFDVQVVRQRRDHDPLSRRQRMKFDEIMLVDKAANRRQTGHDPKRVADIRIANAVQAMSVLGIDGDACAILTDQIARDVERAGRIDDCVADGDAPTRPILGDARQVRMIEPDAHDGGVAVAAEFGIANGVAWFVDQRGEVERVFAIEDHPKRIGAAEDGGRGRLREAKTQFQAGALPR
jgi:hypothetical protein